MNKWLLKYGPKIFGGIAAGIVIGGLLTSCGTHASSPDPQGTEGTRAHVIQEPFGFRNVAFSCFGHNGVYVTSRSTNENLPSGVFVVVNDPQCN